MGIKRRGFRYGLTICIWTFNGSRSITASVNEGFYSHQDHKITGLYKDQSHERNNRGLERNFGQLPVICNEMSEVRWESADTTNSGKMSTVGTILKTNPQGVYNKTCICGSLDAMLCFCF